MTRRQAMYRRKDLAKTLAIYWLIISIVMMFVFLATSIYIATMPNAIVMAYYWPMLIAVIVGFFSVAKSVDYCIRAYYRC